MTAVMDPQRTLRLSPQVLIGGYVNGRKGAVICLSNIVAHLNEQQVRHAIEYLQACLETKAAP